MSVRSTTFSRWLSQPQGLQNLIYRAALPTRLPLLRRQLLPQASRTFGTATKFSSPIPRARLFQYRPFQRQSRRLNSGASSATSGAKKEAGSLAERLRKLTKEYGWAALGVYLGLSALDLPVCFVIVQLLGVDRVGHYERIVVDTVKSKFPSLWPQAAEKTPEEQDAVVETPHEKASKYSNS